MFILYGSFQLSSEEFDQNQENQENAKIGRVISFRCRVLLHILLSLFVIFRLGFTIVHVVKVVHEEPSNTFAQE